MLELARLIGHRPAHSPLSLFYCDHYSFPLPENHKFPLSKYSSLRRELEVDPRFVFHPALPCSRDELLRIHADDYVDAFLKGTLDSAAVRRIGLPWSPELVQRTRASVGGTLLATEAALASGFGGTLAGGTHHAFRNEGSGFCVFNDIAVAFAWARWRRGLTRAAIVDLDVHQGDGTAAIFAGNPDVFTFSVHGARNFPFRKQTSCVDIGLPDGTGDEEYLSALQAALPQVWETEPQIVFFQAGVDPLASDRLGLLSLSLCGLARRDRLVISAAQKFQIPLVITLGGGYSKEISQTVAAHAQTFRIAADVFF